jgi:3-hydroxy-9,10-secoandrosta-1,3,5(10)-triene-9,17-dione monooxygenase reductase component
MAVQDGMRTGAARVELLNEVDQQLFREAISLFATGVTVITACTPAGRAGMTASAVCSLSVEPVQLLVCINERLPTHSALEESRRFAVNVLGEGQSDLARRFATPDVDKFVGVQISECDGIPLLDRAIAHFVCDVHERFPGGDHSIFIGNVRKLSLRRGSRPLLYFASQFGSLSGPEEALLKTWHDRGSVV